MCLGFNYNLAMFLHYLPATGQRPSLRTLLAAVFMFGLSGCQSLRPDQPVSEQAECPVVEVPACPVCPQPVECPVPQVIEKIVTVPSENSALSVPPPLTGSEPELPVIGAVEWVWIEPANLRLEARIDTGAETTSIHAENIQLIEIDEKPYVRYSLLDPSSGKMTEQRSPLVREARIKQQDRELELRYVVNMWLTLGKNREQIEVNLSNREDFEYPLLVGRNMLVDMAIVDVSRHHTLP